MSGKISLAGYSFSDILSSLHTSHSTSIPWHCLICFLVKSIDFLYHLISGHRNLSSAFSREVTQPSEQAHADLTVIRKILDTVMIMISICLI